MENKNLQEIVTINHLGSLFLDGRILLKMDLKEVCCVFFNWLCQNNTVMLPWSYDSENLVKLLQGGK